MYDSMYTSNHVGFVLIEKNQKEYKFASLIADISNYITVSRISLDRTTISRSRPRIVEE